MKIRGDRISDMLRPAKLSEWHSGTRGGEFFIRIRINKCKLLFPADEMFDGTHVFKAKTEIAAISKAMVALGLLQIESEAKDEI